MDSVAYTSHLASATPYFLKAVLLRMVPTVETVDRRYILGTGEGCVEESTIALGSNGGHALWTTFSKTPPLVSTSQLYTPPSPQGAVDGQQRASLAWRPLIWQLSGCLGRGRGEYHSNRVGPCTRKQVQMVNHKISNTFFQ